MSWKYIKFDKENSVGNIILDNPQKNNALNISMRYELTEILHACALDNQIKLITISSSSENFSTGADLSEFNTYTSIIEANLISKQNSLWKDLYSFKKPIICLTRGRVIGSAFEILLLSDFPITELSNMWLDTGTGSFTEEQILAADVNGDGLDDFFVGAAAGQSASLYLQSKNGNFYLALKHS